jgi:hypothetical protein
MGASLTILITTEMMSVVSSGQHNIIKLSPFLIKYTGDEF